MGKAVSYRDIDVDKLLDNPDKCPELGTKEHNRLVGLDERDYFTPGFLATPYYTMLNAALSFARKVGRFPTWTAKHPRQYQPVEELHRRQTEVSTAYVAHMGV